MERRPLSPDERQDLQQVASIIGACGSVVASSTAASTRSATSRLAKADQLPVQSKLYGTQRAFLLAESLATYARTHTEEGWATLRHGRSKKCWPELLIHGKWHMSPRWSKSVSRSRRQELLRYQIHGGAYPLQLDLFDELPGDQIPEGAEPSLTDAMWVEPLLQISEDKDRVEEVRLTYHCGDTDLWGETVVADGQMIARTLASWPADAEWLQVAQCVMHPVARVAPQPVNSKPEVPAFRPASERQGGAVSGKGESNVAMGEAG